MLKDVKKNVLNSLLLLFVATFFSGCIQLNLADLINASQDLKEQVIVDGSKEKILVINVDGVISDDVKSTFLGSAPSMVESIKAQLDLASEDNYISTVIFKINSPGGTTTASDIIYHEIMSFKRKTGKKIIALMMDVAASGGYYIALAADEIVAHPTTITGSIGVIMVTPNFTGAMGKLGIEILAYTSGENKDVGSMFRKPTAEDQEIIRSIVMGSAIRFWGLVEKHRCPSAESFKQIKTAAIFSAERAKELKLIDRIGYFEDVIGQKKSKIIVYRSSNFPNDNVYNIRNDSKGTGDLKLLNLGAIESTLNLPTGTYYLWK